MRISEGGKVIYQSIFRNDTDKKLAAKEREKLISELQKTLSEVETLRGILSPYGKETLFLE